MSESRLSNTETFKQRIVVMNLSLLP